MLPDPLHPAVVHFPIVLMAFLPPRRTRRALGASPGRRSLRASVVPVAMAAALTLSAWAALQTGEARRSEPKMSWARRGSARTRKPASGS